MTTILSARAVRKVYRTGAQEVEALRGVDLDIAEGELLTVMGPSGHGKTTLLNCLSGLDDIDGGTVTIDGVDIHRLRDAERTSHRAARMGFVFQAFNLIPVLTAGENVELPLLVNGVRPKPARRRAAEALARVGLGERVGHRPTELSGGEQQRVAIARALVTEPAIVWADEPTGNLDSQTAAAVLDVLHEAHRAGQTLVLVTHDRTIGASGTRLVQVRDGRVVHDGSPGVLARGGTLANGTLARPPGTADRAEPADAVDPADLADPVDPAEPVDVAGTAGRAEPAKGAAARRSDPAGTRAR